MGVVEKALSFAGKRDVLVLFLLMFIIYNLNFRPISAGDTVPASLIPFNLLDGQWFYMERFVDYYESIFPQAFFFTGVGSHSLSTYPVVLPVLLTPLYVFPWLIVKLAGIPVDPSNALFFIIVYAMEKLAASFIASCAVVFMYLSVKRLFNVKVAAISAIAFALATNMWTISSQGLWQHGLAALLLAASIYVITRDMRKPDDKHMLALGVLSGLLLFNRPADAPLLLPAAWHALSYKNKRSLYYAAAAVLAGAPFLAYNMGYFGSVVGGYSGLANKFQPGLDMFPNLAGILVSPNRGLFIYTPLALLAIPGFFIALKAEDKKLKGLIIAAAAAIALQLVIYANYSGWMGGWCYGPRFLTDMLPLVIIFLAFFINGVLSSPERHKIAAAAFAILLVASLLVQVIGAFYYPNGDWDSQPYPVDEKRAWDFSDTQILRSFNAGPYNVFERIDQWLYRHAS